ncbi:MAG: PspA/IM30 family protein [Bdellovibrionales bacterium]
MGSIKRLVATVTAQFNDIVDQIENHEAVAASAIKRFRTQVHEAKVQVRLLEREWKHAQDYHAKCVKEADLWRARAKSYAESDKEKALECVRRFKSWSQEVEFWQKKNVELGSQVQELRKTLLTIESREQELKLEFQKYVARDRTATIASTSASPGATDESVQDVFRRWDERLTKKEVSAEVSIQSLDEFAREVKMQEDEMDLEETLNSIVKE